MGFLKYFIKKKLKDKEFSLNELLPEESALGINYLLHACNKDGNSIWHPLVSFENGISMQHPTLRQSRMAAKTIMLENPHVTYVSIYKYIVYDVNSHTHFLFETVRKR